MRKLGKVTMAAVLSTAMVMGNVGGNALIGWNMQQVKAEIDKISHVEVNEELDPVNEAYFTLTSCGSVGFEDAEGILQEIKELYRVSEDGNLTLLYSRSDYYSYKDTFRLGKGMYKVVSFGIQKVAFTEESGDSYEQEWNDTFDTANVIKTNTTYTGKLNCYSLDVDHGDETSSDIDCYKINLIKPGKVYVQYTVQDLSTGKNGDYSNYNENIITLYSEDEDGNTNVICKIGGNELKDKTIYSDRYRLPKGNYYISVSSGYQSEYYKYADVTDYQLKVNYTEESAEEYEQEYNDTLDTANLILTNSTYTGNISEEKDVDYFTFTLDKKSSVKLQTKVPRQSTDKLFTFGIYKSNGTSKVAEVKSGTNPTAYTTEKELEAGTYYVIVKKGDAAVESKVDYSINVMESKALSKVNTLSKIVYTQGKLTPKFSETRESYTLTLSKSISRTMIRYYKTDSASTVNINGKNTNMINVKLKRGASKILRITVKAQNGNKKIYKIKVKRQR